jgi:hypothetical protein
MSHKALVAAVSLLLLLLGSAPADSCDCGGLRPPSKAVRTEAPFVFEGKVLEIVSRSFQTRTASGVGDEGLRHGQAAVFEVKRAWNGGATKRMTVSQIWTDCIFVFEVDRTYVVFGWKDPTVGLTTLSCSRTVESSKAADVLAHLGRGTVPK